MKCREESLGDLVRLQVSMQSAGAGSWENFPVQLLRHDRLWIAKLHPLVLPIQSDVQTHMASIPRSFIYIQSGLLALNSHLCRSSDACTGNIKVSTPDGC